MEILIGLAGLVGIVLIGLSITLRQDKLREKLGFISRNNGKKTKEVSLKTHTPAGNIFSWQNEIFRKNKERESERLPPSPKTAHKDPNQ